MEKHIYNEQTGISYTLHGDYYLPDLTLCHLFYEPKEHFFCLLVDVSKVAAELASGQQIEVQSLSVLFDIPQVSLPVYADFSAFFVV